MKNKNEEKQKTPPPIPILISHQLLGMLRDSNPGEMAWQMREARAVALATKDDDSPEALARSFLDYIEGLDCNALVNVFTCMTAGIALVMDIAEHNEDPIVKYQTKGGRVVGGRSAGEGGF